MVLVLLIAVLVLVPVLLLWALFGQSGEAPRPHGARAALLRKLRQGNSGFRRRVS
jgi:hypothetical protein